MISKGVYEPGCRDPGGVSQIQTRGPWFREAAAQQVAGALYLSAPVL
jgi:hypothetical protein